MPPEKTIIQEMDVLLQHLDDGWLLTQHMTIGHAIWLTSKTDPTQPNVRFNLLLQCKRNGYIDIVSEIYPNVVYSISKQGKRALARMKEPKPETIPMNEPPEGKPDPKPPVVKKEYLVPVKPSGSFDACRYDIGDAGYLLILKFDTLETYKMAIEKLGIDQGGVQTPAKNKNSSPHTLVCDYCKKSYTRKLYRKSWKYACNDCKHEYQNEFYLFKKVYGRNPEPKDRETIPV